MTNNYGSNEDSFLIFVCIVIILFFIVLALYFNVVIPFIKSRSYIKREMQRTDGEEYYYWKKELKKLYITHIPILGKFLR